MSLGGVCHSRSSEHAGFYLHNSSAGLWILDSCIQSSFFRVVWQAYADLHMSCAVLLQKPSENKDIPLLFTTPAGQRQGVACREKPP